VTIDRRRFECSTDREGERGLGEAALLLDFRDKVSTKLDLTDRATVDKVAWRRRARSLGGPVGVRPGGGGERIAFRCSMVVVVFFGTSAAVGCGNMVGGSVWVSTRDSYVSICVEN
jgi:hypothetical protein